MTEKHLSITDAKQQLGEIVKRVAYGGERFVIEVRGKASAVISPYDHHKPLNVEEDLALLDRATKLRKEIAAKTGIQEDSAEIIRQMRDERDEQLFGSS
jgi:prevent-host-death family protein